MKTDKINMVINLSILALLIYLAVAVKSLQKDRGTINGETLA